MIRIVALLSVVLVAVVAVQGSQATFTGGASNGASSFATYADFAPAVTLTTPAAGAVTNATPTLSGAAGNSTGDSNTVTVKIYSGTSATGTQIQTLSAPVSNGSWSIVSPALAVGNYTARAEQADAAGNTGLSSANTFTIRRGGGKAAAVAVAPTVSSARVAPARFRLGSGLPRISRRTPVGTTISFGLSGAARVTLAFARPKQPGRLVAGRCVAPSRRNRRGRACTRSLPMGSLRLNGTAGRNRMRFQGRLSRHKTLRPGRYITAITASDAAGNRSAPRTVSFTVVPGP